MRGQPKAPWIKWRTIMDMTAAAKVNPSNTQLCFLDCCHAGLASVGEDIEVLGAATWNNLAPAADLASFSRALVDELKQLNGASITVSKLSASMANHRELIKLGRPRPFHKPSSDPSRQTALIHVIMGSPTPPPGPTMPPRFAHVMITANISRPDTIPSAEQFSKWVSENIPAYVGDITIDAQWKSNSVTVVLLLPLEVWQNLPDRRAYKFIDFRFDWDGEAHRRNMAVTAAARQRGLLNPPVPAQGENLRPGAGRW